MPRAQRPQLLRALLLGAVLATSASATYIRSNLVFPRADVCGGDASLSRCSQTGLPDSFCCNTGTKCIPLAGDTTVLCCPEGSTCENINPIVCDLSLQDPAKNPKAAIKTTVLGGKLETCGGGCCPYGYSCEDGSCTLDDDQSKKPSTGGASPSSTKTPQPSSTASASASDSASSKPTSTASKGEVGTAQPSTDDNTHPPEDTFPTGAVVGGVVGGIGGIIGVTVLVMMFRYRRQQAAKKRHDSSSSFGNIISAPQPIHGYQNQRQDFLAKAATTSSAATTPTYAQERFVSHNNNNQQQNSPPFFSPSLHSPQQPYAGTEMAEPHHHQTPRSHHPSAEVGGLGLRDLTSHFRYSGAGGYGGGLGLVPPRTPRERRRSESINIFADPSTVGSGSSAGGYRDTAYTTWTNIMADGERTPGLPDSPTRRR